MVIGLLDCGHLILAELRAYSSDETSRRVSHQTEQNVSPTKHLVDAALAGQAL
jgi:hypothetical protein